MDVLESLNVGGPAFFRNRVYAYGGIDGAGGGGGISLPYVAKTGAYTLTDADYAVNVTSGTFTLTLPTAVGIAGRIYVIKNSGTGTVTVDANGSETIDGALTAALLSRYSSITIQSDGSNWIIIAAISPVDLS